MFSDREVSKKISELLLEVSGLLDESVGIAVAGGAGEEASEYMKIVGGLLGVIGVDVLNEIYRSHPSLKPVDYYLP